VSGKERLVKEEDSVALEEVELQMMGQQVTLMYAVIPWDLELGHLAMLRDLEMKD
jgi:hypothetical protein